MALSFQTSGRYVRLLYAVPATANTTHMAWCYIPTIQNQGQGILAMSGDPTLQVTVQSTGAIAFQASSTASIISTSAAPAKSWFHVAMSMSSTDDSHHTAFGYINGVLVTTISDPTQYFGSSEIRLPDSQFQTFGYVRDYRCWSRTLTSTEIAQEYRSATPVHRGPSLAVWSTFDNDTFKNKGSANLKWLTVGGTAVLVGLGGTGQGKRRRRRAF